MATQVATVEGHHLPVPVLQAHLRPPLRDQPAFRKITLPSSSHRPEPWPPLPAEGGESPSRTCRCPGYQRPQRHWCSNKSGVGRAAFMPTPNMLLLGTVPRSSCSQIRPASVCCDKGPQPRFGRLLPQRGIRWRGHRVPREWLDSRCLSVRVFQVHVFPMATSVRTSKHSYAGFAPPPEFPTAPAARLFVVISRLFQLQFHFS